MIKINSIYGNFLFSTIRYAEEYVRTFQLNKQVRSCLNLTELQQFIRENDQKIKQYGKTIILQSLNQFPLAYNFRSLNSQMKVYLYVLELQDLNIYEEQLRYNNLLKLIEYAPHDSSFIQTLIKAQQKIIEKRIQIMPFDFVDAFNWIIMHRNIKYNSVVHHALEVVCSQSLEKSQTNLNRVMNIFLKRINQLQWYHIRVYKKLFHFICNKYELSHDKTNKNIISILERLTQLKLHLMGYNVPKVFDQIYDRIKLQSANLSLLQLQVAFQAFQYLPYGYNQQMFGYLFKLIIQRISMETVFLPMFPFSRMNLCQRKLMIKTFVTKNFSVADTLFFINTPQVLEIQSEVQFLDAIYNKFIKPIHIPEYVSIILYNAYIAIGAFLFRIYYSDSKKIEQISSVLKQVHRIASYRFKQYELIQTSSLCNLFHVMYFHLRLGLMQYKEYFEKTFAEKINLFHSKKFTYNWKVNKHFAQILEAVVAYKNSKEKAMLQHLNKFLVREIRECKIFDYGTHSEFIFQIQEAEQPIAFSEAIQTFYNRVQQQNKWLAFGETYVAYTKKTVKLTRRVLEQTWKRQDQFGPVAKVIAAVPSHFFSDCEGGLAEPVKSILRNINLENIKHQIGELTINQLQMILSFCQKYYLSAQQFARYLFKSSLRLSEQNFQGLSMDRPVDSQLKFLYSLAQICVKMAGSEMKSDLMKIVSLVKRVSGGNDAMMKYTRAKQIELRLSLKSILGIDEYSLKQQIYGLSVSQDQMTINSRTKLLLLKLHVKQEVLLQQLTIDTFVDQINQELQLYKLGPNQIIEMLGAQFLDGYSQVNVVKVKPIIRIIRFIHQKIKAQQSIEYYFYCLQFAYRFGEIQIAQNCLLQLVRYPLSPYHIIRVPEIIIQKTFACQNRVNMRLLTDVIDNVHLLKRKQSFLTRYLQNCLWNELPIEIHSLLSRIVHKVQADLITHIRSLKQKGSVFSESLEKEIVRMLCFYFCFVIKNKWRSASTLQIYRFFCSSGEEICQKVVQQDRDAVLIKFYLFTHYFLELYSDSTVLQSQTSNSQHKQQQKVKKNSYFSSRKKESIAPLHSDIENHLQKGRALLNKFRKELKFKHAAQIRTQLKQLNLKELAITSKSSMEIMDNCYIFDYAHNNLYLPLYIKKDSKEYTVFCVSSALDRKSVQALLESITGLRGIVIKEGSVIILE